MTMADIINGPVWVLYLVTGVVCLMAVMLLSGHGSWLIAGYNTMSPAGRERYDRKKLCRVMGAGMGVIGLLLLAVSLFLRSLPAWFSNVMIGVVLADIVIMLILCNTVCKK